jgi:hypothetical protein
LRLIFAAQSTISGPAQSLNLRPDAIFRKGKP